MDEVTLAPRCPACAKVLPAANLERCLWCRAPMAGGAPRVEEYGGPGPVGSVPHVARSSRRPSPPPWPVRAAGVYLRVLAVGIWIATAVAVARWLMVPDPIKFLRSEQVIGGLFLGLVVGVFVWRMAPGLERGEPSARLKATVLFVLHLLGLSGWVIGLGLGGLAALHAGAGARWFARRRVELYAEEDEVRPYWRKNGIDGT